MKLSKRLKQIEQMVTSEYSHIWDCCCDHGFLGAALLSRNIAEHIHFVDIVPELMNELNGKLHNFYPNDQWTTHCIDVANLPLDQYKGEHLIIIAGVGGDLMIKFINEIIDKHPTLSIDFLLCPVHHQYNLRKQLILNNLRCVDEVLIKENKRFYEVIYVSSTIENTYKISSVGENIWHFKCSEQGKIAEEYLSKTLEHYQRIQNGKTTDVQYIIDEYKAVTL